MSLRVLLLLMSLFVDFGLSFYSVRVVLWLSVTLVWVLRNAVNLW